MRQVLQQSVTGDSELIKRINLSIVINTIREKGPISRVEIAKLSKLNKATVSSLVDELLEKDYVVEIGAGRSSVGRKPILLNFNDSSGYVIGIEVNVGFIKAVVINLSAEVIAKRKIPTSTNEKEVMKSLYDVIDEMKGLVPECSLGVVGIGISVAGIVNYETGTLVSAPNAGLHNIPLKHLVESYSGIRTIVDNDCNASAIGEYYFGSGKGRDQLILLSLSAHGIGTGIFVNGEVFRGRNGFAGEMGHMTINMVGPLCNCGNRGCWELYASPRALIQDYMEKKGLVDAPTVEEIIEMANQNDKEAISALTQVGEYLGVGLSNVVNTFDTEAIIIRGAMSQGERWLLNPIQRNLQERCFFYSSTKVEIIPSFWGQDAAAVGAACEIIQRLFYTHEYKL
ncbi:ROK family transcriptional regulator [Alkalihalobacillus sp. 1P02AB]|uniref:ROK family transcriptional regulator n=1 Tax=Alkalihalobacillus sp. 1P02AB TaxID=3132260 RepID=UPI0039A473E8